MSTDDPERTNPAPHSHPSADDLRRELDGRTGPEESARITGHLDGCEACSQLLDEVAGTSPAPALAADHDPPPYNPRWMRRAVGRTMLSIAWRTALLLVVVVVASQFAGAVVIHPLLVERGDRLEAHVVASVDLPVLLRPGAEVRDVNSNIGVLRRTTEVRYERAVGAARSDLGSYETRLGPLATTTAVGSGPITSWRGPRLSEDPVDGSPVPFDPERAGQATAATVELTWSDAISRAQVADLSADDEDVVMTWVGFRIGEQTSQTADRGEVLGYGACARGFDRLYDELFGTSGPISGGFGTSGGLRQFPPPEDGIAHALEQVRRATDNLARSGWLDDEDQVGEGPLADVAATARWLQANDPEVASVVLTGPTPALAEIVAAAEPDTVELLELELDRGAPEPCA